MNIDVFTIFPEYLAGPLAVSLLGRARAAGLLDVSLHDPRAFTTDVHHAVDDSPFGGGAGMVMMPEPLFAAVEAVQPARPLLLLSASGPRFDQRRARELAACGGFSLLCGRYEGVDQRVADHCCDGELSVGDYVLAGGEAAALVVIEAVTRLVPGVMGNEASSAEESFGTVSAISDGTTDGAPDPSTAAPPAVSTSALVEYPQYTRPAQFRDWAVPAVLRSGDHARIARWRHAQALRRTIVRRPDLVVGPLSAEEEQLLAEFPPEDGDR
jgi:tRNA (guanine37-N1)-methyltransferase